MSTVTIPFVKPGDIVERNEYVTETIPPLEAQLIQTENYRTEAFHKPHFFGDEPGTVLYRSAGRTEIVTTPTYLSSATFAQWYTHEVILTSPSDILEGNVLRLHTTINIRDYSTIGGNKGEFEFAYYWDVGAGYVRIPDSATFRYSAAPLDREGPSPWAPRENWRVGFSYCKPIETFTTLTGIKLYYRMIDTWSVWGDYSTTSLFVFRN